METRNITSNEEEERVLSTRGKKKTIVTFAGTTIVGAAIGAAIIGGKPKPKDDAKLPEPEKPVTGDSKDDVTGIANDNAVTNIVDNNVKPATDKKVDNKPDEPKPTDDNDKDAKNDDINTTDDNTVKTDEKDIAKNDDQVEIDKITDDLLKGSQVDDRDLADSSGLLDDSVPVSVALPNGLETTGVYFSDFGDDLVLLDLDGDGVFDDVKLVEADGSLRDFHKELHLNDGSVISYEEWMASNHITGSDIEQILNETGSNDLAMTEDDRRRMEEDNADEDIVVTDDVVNNQLGEDVLTKEEEDALLKQLLSENEEEDGDFDEDTLSDEELEAILIDTKQDTQALTDDTGSEIASNDLGDFDYDITVDIHTELD
jgi:hypothetical protein